MLHLGKATLGIIFTCHKEIGCTFELWDQTVSLEDWLESSARLVADPIWPTGGRHLTDLRSGDTISAIYDSDLDEVSDLFSIYAERIAGLKLAIVAPEQARRRPELFVKFVSVIGVKAEVFETLKDACAWLGIDFPQAENVLVTLRAEIRTRSASK